MPRHSASHLHRRPPTTELTLLNGRFCNVRTVNQTHGRNTTRVANPAKSKNIGSVRTRSIASRTPAPPVTLGSVATAVTVASAATNAITASTTNTTSETSGRHQR